MRGKGTSDDHFAEQDEIAQRVATDLGVQFIHTDLLNWKPPFEEASLDAVMSFHNIEHLHHSPRGLYREMVGKLKIGGLFLLAGPNAAHALKRLRVLAGKNIFSKFDDWYSNEHFIGHVREPIVADLSFIAQDLKLDIVSVFGRNWLGLQKLPQSCKSIGNLLSQTLEAFPSLCSELYLLAKRTT